MYILYNIILILLTVLLSPVILFKLITVPKYRGGISQKLGRVRKKVKRVIQGTRPIWVHAVSVGEVMAAHPLIRELKKKYPGRKLILSTVTVTGNYTARQRVPEADAGFFFTFHYPCNGRISGASYKNYLKFRRFFSQVFGQVTLFCMQSREDAVRIKDIGAPADRVTITGNLKFDQKIPTIKSTPVSLRAGSKVITAGSTHRGEEAALLDVFRRLREKFPELVLIIAPRHPERFDEVAGLVNRAGYDCQRRTRLKSVIKDVLLLDTIGELRSFYAICDIAFVGGSLVKVGGHNLLEPAAMKKPVIFSRYMFNFKEISEALISAGGCILVKDKQELYIQVDKLLSDKKYAQQIGDRAFTVIEANSGAAKRTIDAVSGLIGEN